MVKATEEPGLRTKKYLKFSKSLKTLRIQCTKVEKLGYSFEDNKDSNLIAEKFWSYVEATSNNTCIRGMIDLDDVFNTDMTDLVQFFKKDHNDYQG